MLTSTACPHNASCHDYRLRILHSFIMPSRGSHRQRALELHAWCMARKATA
jgi:hypothetical protein